MFNLEQLLRPNIRTLTPYASARDEYQGAANVWLDANENPYGGGLNRYPDPYQRQLRQIIAQVKGVDEAQLFLGNGSDEAIDLLFRAFCRPTMDKVLLFPPTYGMYKVTASINDIQILEIPLSANFQIDVETALKVLDTPTLKLIFICSPNNPTGNLIHPSTIFTIAERFHGLVVVDEAYVDFAPGASLLAQLAAYPNLVILQTFSKAWGLAGIRLGMAFAAPPVIRILQSIKAPYNVSSLTQQTALKALQQHNRQRQQVQQLLEQRQWLREALTQFDFVQEVYPSNANFLLLRVEQPKVIYHYLLDRQIVVRNRSSVVQGCLRISIGTPKENQQLIHELKQLSAKL